jgi:succinate dehydrogenase hydrophobic anchor subunit
MTSTLAAVGAERDASADAPSERSASPVPWVRSVLDATSIVLFVLVPVEVVSWFVSTDVARHTAATIHDRWDSSLWRVVDLTFVVLALVHGGLGATRALLAGGSVQRGRYVLASLVSAVVIAVGVLAVYSVFTVS